MYLVTICIFHFSSSSDLKPERHILSHSYHKLMPQWLKYGFEMNVPAVKTHSIKLISRYVFVFFQFSTFR